MLVGLAKVRPGQTVLVLEQAPASGSLAFRSPNSFNAA